MTLKIGGSTAIRGREAVRLDPSGLDMLCLCKYSITGIQDGVLLVKYLIISYYQPITYCIDILYTTVSHGMYSIQSFYSIFLVNLHKQE